MSWHLCWASLGLFWSGPGLMLVHNTDLEIASFHLFSPWVLPRSTTLTCSFSWFLWSEGWSPLRILASHAIVQPTQLELSYKQAAGEPFVRRPFPSSSGWKDGLFLGFQVPVLLPVKLSIWGLASGQSWEWNKRWKKRYSKSPAHKSHFPRPLAGKKAILLEFWLSVLAA